MSYWQRIRESLAILNRAVLGKPSVIDIKGYDDVRLLLPEHMRGDDSLDLQSNPITTTDLRRAGVFLLTQLDLALDSKRRYEELFHQHTDLEGKQFETDRALANAYRDIDIKERANTLLREDCGRYELYIDQLKAEIEGLKLDAEIAAAEAKEGT